MRVMITQKSKVEFEGLGRCVKKEEDVEGGGDVPTGVNGLAELLRGVVGDAMKVDE